MKNNSYNLITAFIAFVIAAAIFVCLTGCAMFSVKPTVSVPNKVVISLDKQEVKDLTTLVNHQFTVASVKAGVPHTTTIKLTPTAPYNGFFWIGGIAVVLGIAGTISAIFKGPTLGYKISIIIGTTGIAILGATAFIKEYGKLLLDIGLWSLIIGILWLIIEHNKSVVQIYLKSIFVYITSVFGSLRDYIKSIFLKKKTTSLPETPTDIKNP